jgi:hypothetical protein
LNKVIEEKRIMTEQGRRLSCVKESDEKDSERKIYELTSTATSVDISLKYRN